MGMGVSEPGSKEIWYAGLDIALLFSGSASCRFLSCIRDGWYGPLKKMQVGINLACRKLGAK